MLIVYIPGKKPFKVYLFEADVLIPFCSACIWMVPNSEDEIFTPDTWYG